MVQKLDLQQAKKAISALYKYNKKNAANDMLDSDEENGVFVQFTTHKIMNKAQLKRTKVALKHTPYADSVEVCLITKPSEKEMEDKVKSISPIKKVVSVSTLATTYKNFESRRKLCDSYDIFLVDDRVVHLMPKLLGKNFFSKNKFPVAIKISSLKKSVESALNATYVKLNNGTNTLVTIGNFGMSEKDILENYEAAIPQLVKIIAHNWDQVQLIGLKSTRSPVLPIHLALPKSESTEESGKKTATKEKPATKKETPTKKEAPAKKAAPVKKETSEKKAAPAKKATPVKKEVPAKKAASTKKAAPAKAAAVAPAKKTETKKVTKKVVKSKK